MMCASKTKLRLNEEIFDLIYNGSLHAEKNTMSTLWINEPMNITLHACTEHTKLDT